MATVVRDASPTGALAQLAAIIAREPHTASRLASFDAAGAFVRALVALAGERHIRFDADDELLLADVRLVACGCRLEAWPLTARHAWTPISFVSRGDGLELVWGFGSVQAHAPFHESSYMTLRMLPLNRMFAVRTPLSPAFVAQLEADALPIAGLIFHMSRCGSTLLAQGLKAWRGTRVYSEPALLDEALVAQRAGRDNAKLGLRAVVAALAQPADSFRRVVVKLDAWHALAMARIDLQLHAPRLFVYRDPLEVMVSHSRAPGSHVVRGVLEPDWSADERRQAAALGPGDYAAFVIGRICAAVAAHAPATPLLNYTELRGAIVSRAAKVFALDDADLDWGLLTSTIERDAKHPHRMFTDDTSHKRGAANAVQRAAVARWITPHYDALERIRRGSAS